MVDATYISKDPFARETLTRTVCRTLSSPGFSEQTCSWCGSNHHHRLFRYYIEPDAGQQHPIDGLFCSVGCMRIYHS